MEGRGRFNATSGRSASAIRENGMRGRGRRKKRKGRGKVIIGGPWRYACGVSLHFLINFYPEYILGGKREATVLPLPSRIFVRSRVGTQHVHFFPFAVFVYLFIYLFIFFTPVVWLSRRFGGEVSLGFRPISGIAPLSVTSYGNLINSFSGELLPSEAEFKPA